jgi:type VI secretion system secreted protein VgrG
MPEVTLAFEGGEFSLSVRRIAVREAVSELFAVTVTALSPEPDIDLEAIIGKRASLDVSEGWFAAEPGGGRRFAGVVSRIEQVKAEPTGLSTYQLVIVPVLWLATQRRNLRTFQHLSAPDIAARILADWDVQPEWEIDKGAYPRLHYKVQYDETDYAFFCRILAEAGIAFVHEDAQEGDSRLVLSDHLHARDPRPGPPIPYLDNPGPSRKEQFVTSVRIAREVRPGSLTLRDFDFRNPGFPLSASAEPDPDEQRYEHYRYEPGSFLVEVDKGGGTPVADDKAFARHDARAGQERADRLLAAERGGGQAITFLANAVDLRPGVVLSIAGHPHADLDESRRLLLTESAGEGDVDGLWGVTCTAVFATGPYRPKLPAPKPRISGVQSAIVVGPPSQAIHTDEHGRVRVQFQWDRLGGSDDNSSPWVRVGQGWAGTGFGVITLPRVGQEVLVGFLDGDPEQPIVVGRVFNARSTVPYKLPEQKTVSTFRSESTPGGAGYNEILFDDAKGRELFGIRAERDLRKLVKRDETSTVGRHRSALVVGDEVEVTNGHQTTFVGKDRRRLVKGDETEHTHGDVLLRVGKDLDVRVAENRREQVNRDSHLHVQGSRKISVDKSSSLTVQGDRFEKVGGSYALAAGQEIHVKAGAALVIEAQDLTLKGPGGFLRIDAGGVTIKGTLVKINSAGGSPGDGAGAQPQEPESPREIAVDEPEIDDVSKTGHGPTGYP